MQKKIVLSLLLLAGCGTPLLDAKTLQEIGYRIAIFPGLGFLAAGAALDRRYQK